MHTVNIHPQSAKQKEQNIAPANNYALHIRVYITTNKAEYIQYEHTRRLCDLMTLISTILLYALSL